MSLTPNELKPGTVAVAHGKVAFITDYHPSKSKYPIIYKTNVGAKSIYKGSPSEFTAVIGTFDIDKFSEASGAVPKAKAADASNYPDALLPEVLKGLKVGDPIKIRERGVFKTVTYLGYKPRRPKNSVDISINGKEYRAPLSIVFRVDATGTKRPEAVILKDIEATYLNLSPENLTGDGELPKFVVSSRRSKLNSKLKALFAEIGRTVTEEEAYASVA